MKKVEFYKAIDGALFTEKEDCLTYEKEYFQSHPTIAMFCTELRQLANDIENAENLSHTKKYDYLTISWQDFKEKTFEWINSD